MKNKTKVLIVIVLVLALLVNAFAYIGIINGSNTITGLIKKVNFAYVTPKVYFNLAKRVQRKPQQNNDSAKQQENVISEKSHEFIAAAFRRDDAGVKKLLDPSAKLIRSKDGSSFIRYVENGVFVEGYMATDKKLVNTKQRWYIVEEDHTVTCSMEVYIEGNKSPELWYIHFRKVKDDWKIYMLENNI